ncbi:MAG TPA: hypothetical protein VGJ70_03770 [Solirubrobacteraceae bacterium]|jgi:hypothetical protein
MFEPATPLAPTTPPAPPGYLPWVRERGVGTSGTWHRPVTWPPLDSTEPVATLCRRGVVVAYSANIGVGGRPHPACPTCAP